MVLLALLDHLVALCVFFTLSLLTLLIPLVGLVSLYVFYAKWKFDYWSRRNVFTPPPNLIFGNAENPFKRTMSPGEQIQKAYQTFKKNGTKHNGAYLFTRPRYIPIDLDEIKNIMTKDFSHFTDRGAYVNEKADPLSGHLFALGGMKWRNIRTKLTPTFSSGKMKMMFSTVAECSKILEKRMEKLPKTEIDIKDVLSGFTTDIIGSCAFGLDIDSINNDESLFKIYGKKLFASTPLEVTKQLFIFSLPSVGHFFGVKLTPSDVSDFFLKVVKDTVNYREENHITRNDFLQLLINVRNDKDNAVLDGSTLTLNEIAAECFVFFIAGFETSSTTMTFALYEMGKNQDIQEKVRKEIQQVLNKHGDKVSYDSLTDLKYMEQVIDETLRMYPPLPFVPRICVKDYKFSDGSGVVIEKGIQVHIPILAIHHDEEYYPEPWKFDPERFTQENKKNRHPYAYIPFGEGPRICIGARFAIMQIKIGLIHLLKNYRFTVNSRTSEPLKLSKKSVITSAEGGIWLDAHKL